MAKISATTVKATTRLGEPRVQAAFGTVKSCFTAYGALTAVALTALAVLSVNGTAVTPFMWIRSVVLLAIAVLLHRMAVSASRGSGKAFERVRVLSASMPIAIIAVDLIPGVCPMWFAAMQAACTLPIIGAALVIYGPTLRTIPSKASMT